MMRLPFHLLPSLGLLCLQLSAQKLDPLTPRIVAGSLSGTIATSEGKALKRATIVFRLQPGTGVDLPDFVLHAVANPQGEFSLRTLPVGRYTICPQAPDEDVVSPCDWVRRPQEVEILNGRAATVKIVMAIGHRVRFQVDDAARVLESNAAKIRPPSVTVGVITPHGFLSARPTTRAAVRRDYEIVVPYATPSEALIMGAGVELEDDKGKKAVNQTIRVPLRLKVGDSPKAAVAKITGVVGEPGRL